MKKSEQKQHLIDMMIGDENLGLYKETEQMNLGVVSGSLPSLDDATKVAVRISEEAITPPLDAKEQALFIAGFQECMKWLNVVFGTDR
jgi:hypothetical protein